MTQPISTAVLALLLFALLRLQLAAAHAADQPPRSPSGLQPEADSISQPPFKAAIVSAAPPALPPIAGYVPDSKYSLRPGDRVSFQILEDRDTPRSLIVADSGELDFPYVGRLLATGKTCKQLCDELKPVLEKEFYYRATLVLALDVASRSLGRVYVWGQVKNPGPLEVLLNENLTVGKAILRAGGFADFAGRKKVKLVRVKPGDPASKQVFELNMVEILDAGKTERDILLQPEDSIIVPSRLINF